MPSIVATSAIAIALATIIAFDYDNRYQFQGRHRHHWMQQWPTGWLGRGLSLLICALLPATPRTRNRYMDSQRRTGTDRTEHHAPAAGGCVRWSIKHKSLPPPPPPSPPEAATGMEDFGEGQQQHQQHRRRTWWWWWWSRCPALLHRMVSEAIKEFNFTSPTTTNTTVMTMTTRTTTMGRPSLDSRWVEHAGRTAPSFVRHLQFNEIIL
uniref:Uncharacterized protein n=1 Tax=Anopheles darlingi TaxID=43151 RepID=A0A2M4CZS0_ANODA